MTFKPMLAPHELPDFTTLRYPLMASPKLDGIRAMVQGGTLLSRTLKPIPNEFIQKALEGLPQGTDGELVQGNPSADPYKRSHSIVMSQKPLDFFGDTVRYYIFDQFGDCGFVTRLHVIQEQHLDEKFPVVYVPHQLIANVEELEEFESICLGHGYEGVMLRSVDGPYKQGRATLKSGWLLKVKRFEDAEARIISAYEEMENNNVAFTNELGRTARSSHKANKNGKAQLGGFHCVGVNGRWAGVDFDVSSSAIDHVERRNLWEARESHVGKIITYKFFPKGSDERPRHPVFKGFRSADDMEEL